MTALEMTNELLDLLPNHERASGNKVYYEQHLEKEKLINTHRPEIKRKGDDGTDEITAESWNPVCLALAQSIEIKETA